MGRGFEGRSTPRDGEGGALEAIRHFDPADYQKSAPAPESAAEGLGSILRERLNFAHVPPEERMKRMAGVLEGFGYGKAAPFFEAQDPTEGAEAPATEFMHHGGEVRQPDGEWVSELPHDDATGKEVEIWNGGGDLPTQEASDTTPNVDDYVSNHEVPTMPQSDPALNAACGDLWRRFSEQYPPEVLAELRGNPEPPQIYA